MQKAGLRAQHPFSFKRLAQATYHFYLLTNAISWVLLMVALKLSFKVVSGRGKASLSPAIIDNSNLIKTFIVS
ncbi:MAG: hypothetical protein H7Y18_03410 [Clostridiaceae bacterium]|nr:hypothetical protein [Clostridiaceae bacterium]